VQARSSECSGYATARFTIVGFYCEKFGNCLAVGDDFAGYPPFSDDQLESDWHFYVLERTCRLLRRADSDRNAADDPGTPARQ
jgi:hypothetical protein